LLEEGIWGSVEIDRLGNNSLPHANYLGLIEFSMDIDEYEKEALPAYDGVAETGFDDTAAMRLSATGPEYTATRADEKHFLTEPLPFIITREVRIV